MSEVREFHGQSVEIRRIQLGGIARPVAFVMYTYVLFKRKTGIDFFSLTKDSYISDEDALCLYHCAFVVGGLITGEDFDIDFEPDFMIMVDANTLIELSGVKEMAEATKTEEAGEQTEKNGQSQSLSKTSKRNAVAK